MIKVNFLELGFGIIAFSALVACSGNGAFYSVPSTSANSSAPSPITAGAPSPTMPASNNSSKTNTTIASILLPSPSPSASTLTRTLRLSALSNSVHQLVKILFLIDGSPSMTKEIQTLSSGIDSLVDSLKGRNIAFYGLPLEDNYSVLRNYSYRLSDGTITPNAPNWESNPTVFPFSQILDCGIIASKYLDPKTAVLSPTASAEDISKLKLLLKKGIASASHVGTVPAAGRATLLRELDSNSIFKAGDVGAVVLLSNENDGGAPFQNIYKQTETIFKGSSSIIPAKISMKLTEYTYNVLVVGTDKLGNLVSTPSAVQTLRLACSDANFASGICQRNVGSSPIACLSGEVATLSKRIDNAQIINCTAKDIATATSTVVDATVSCSGPYIKGGVSYANFGTWLMKVSYGITDPNSVLDCSIGPAVSQLNTLNTKTTLYSTTADATASDSVKFNTAIRDRINSLFGKNFLLSTIVHGSSLDPASCRPLSPGQSDGNSYLELVDFLGVSGNKTSICSSDYSPALREVSDFVLSVAQTHYVFDKLPSEKLTGIQIDRKGILIPLLVADYTLSGEGVLDIADSKLLKAGDVIVLTFSKQ